MILGLAMYILGFVVAQVEIIKRDQVQGFSFVELRVV